MITRRELKTDAKKVLKRRYWPFFIVGLIQYVVVSLLFVNVRVGGFESLKERLLFTMLFGLSMLVVQVFLVNPFRAAYAKFIVVNSENEKTDYKVMWETLKDNYITILKATFMRDLLITVCSIPFYVGIGLMGMGLTPIFMRLDMVAKLMAFQSFFSPSLVMTTFYYMVFFVGCIIAAAGFILLLYRAYSYRMVDFLIGDMPESSWEDILFQSKKIMKRNKFFALTLDISFLGWIILVSFIQIGSFFLYPYIDATNAQFYMRLKDKKNTETQTII